MRRQFLFVNKQKNAVLISISFCLLLGCLVFYSLAPRASINPSSDSQIDMEKAKKLYLSYCAGCHGEKGDGLGKAAEFLYPKPRDFTKGLFKIRTTPSGSLPTDEDLLRTISEGMHGSGMPNFNFMSLEERKALVQHLKTFSEAFQYRQPDPQVTLSAEPAVTPQIIEAGRKIYEKMECGKCHGDKGKGDGPSATALKDDWQIPIKVRDFTTGIYKGGPTNKDLYLRFTTGMNGTPMPAYVGELMTNQERWYLVHYVQSLRTQTPLIYTPPEDAFIQCSKVKGEIPLTPESKIWNKASFFEISVFPLWQTDQPFTGLKAKAIHNNQEIAFFLEWLDPTCDTSFNKVQDFRDAVALQFSLTEEVGALAMGDKEHPVNIWHWKADWQSDLSQRFVLEKVYPNLHRDFHWFQDDPTQLKTYLTGQAAGNLFSQSERHSSVEDLNAKGFGTLSPQDVSSQNVQGNGDWENGVWKVIFIRSLNSKDSGDIKFSKDKKIPIAFSIWDGSQKDRDGQKYFSSWCYLQLADK